MSAPESKSSSSSGRNTSPKPKRPLTGYNLFYRYKRNCVLEATGRGGSTSPEEEKIAIQRVLAAPPGLEGVPLDHAIWILPTEAADQIRVRNIKAAMEGKLFPNENASKRLHRKVHGCGFVEMGRAMRDLWAHVDKVTKDAFHELAELGRARYRILLAEHDERRNRAEVDDGAPVATAAVVAGAPSKSDNHVPAKATAAIPAVPAKMESMSVPPENPIVTDFLASFPLLLRPNGGRPNPSSNNTRDANDILSYFNKSHMSNDNKHNDGINHETVHHGTFPWPPFSKKMSSNSSVGCVLQTKMTMAGGRQVSISNQDANDCSQRMSLSSILLRPDTSSHSTNRKDDEGVNEINSNLGAFPCPPSVRKIGPNSLASGSCLDSLTQPLAIQTNQTPMAIGRRVSTNDQPRLSVGNTPTGSDCLDSLIEPLAVQTNKTQMAGQMQVSTNNHRGLRGSNTLAGSGCLDLLMDPIPVQINKTPMAECVFGLTEEDFMRGAAQRNASIVSNEPVAMHDNEIIGMWNKGDEAGVADESRYFASSGLCSSIGAYQNVNARFHHLLNNSGFPPPPLIQARAAGASPMMVPTSAGERRKTSPGGDPGAVAPSLALSRNKAENPPTKDVQDLIRTIDKALDDHRRCNEVESRACHPSYVFQRPVHDIESDDAGSMSFGSVFSDGSLSKSSNCDLGNPPMRPGCTLNSTTARTA